MKQLFAFLFLFYSLFSYSMTRDEFTEQARSELSQYGLLKCLRAYLPNKKIETLEDENPLVFEDNIEDMLRKAIMLYGFQWGNHFIYQNEDTLEIIYNPYDEVEKFLKSISYLNYSKAEIEKGVNPVIRCLNAYNSEEYKNFIRSMDKYIKYYKFEEK